MNPPASELSCRNDWLESSRAGHVMPFRSAIADIVKTLFPFRGGSGPHVPAGKQSAANDGSCVGLFNIRPQLVAHHHAVPSHGRISDKPTQ